MDGTIDAFNVCISQDYAHKYWLLTVCDILLNKKYKILQIILLFQFGMDRDFGLQVPKLL